MPTNDDQFWHGVLASLAREYHVKAEVEHAAHRHEAGAAWEEAATELNRTIDEALDTNTLAERLVMGEGE